MSKHTPGPWRLASRKEGWVVKNSGGCSLAGVSKFSGGSRAAECEPNAQLIAAAPELLDALREGEELLAMICTVICAENPPPYGLERLEKMRHAIARAEGR